MDNLDNYVTEKLSKVQYVPEQFKPHIRPVYPPNNNLIFEEWFYTQFSGCKTYRRYLPIFFTSYWVNHDYGNDKQSRTDLEIFVNSLDKSKKYFTIIQYDNGSMIDWEAYGLDVLEFNMSMQVGVQLPLICQPNSIRYNEPKRYLASFIGSITHPIRTKVIESLRGKEGYYISTEHHDYDSYNKIISQSLFCISPRGYGAASFRCYAESIYQGAIPIYISDVHIIPFGIKFNEFGILVNESEITELDRIITSIEPSEIIEKQNMLPVVFDEYFSYIGCMRNIINVLENG